MSTENPYYLEIDQVRRFLPHRQPFLLIDRVLEIHPVGDVRQYGSLSEKVGTKVIAIKNVTYNEPYFAGHFPEFAIMPGVLLIEAMAQTASFSLYPYLEHDIDRLSRDFQCILVGVDSARFRRRVIPGDTIRLECTVTKVRGKLWGFNVQITVDGQKAAEADILANLIVKGDAT